MGKLNSEVGKLKANGKEPDKKKSKNNQCVETNRGFFFNVISIKRQKLPPLISIYILKQLDSLDSRYLEEDEPASGWFKGNIEGY